MNVPETLPAQLYLLAYDQDKHRLAGGMYFRYLLRAAALTELLFSGRIADESGKVRPVEHARPLDDPVLAQVLQQISESKPRSWQHWIRTHGKATAKAVRDELEAGRWIKVELQRPFLIFSRTVIHVRDPRVVKRLAAEVSAALSAPLTRVEDREAALVALAATAELKTVFPRKRRRTHKDRIAALQERGGPAAPALRKVIQQAQAAAAAAG
ncbi:GPP34 family phosphoprotein [Thermopolyspora sp. NPDC052614]|uniref:GOLPH3/VPS74 family protein n=1 Tax=Thermopolyspora sp. NPDC052614 TaxID=3155682 RepID=UPI003432F37A